MDTGSMTAKAMIAALLIQIPVRFLGARAWRRQVQAGKTEDGRFLRAGVPGEPDVEGIFPVFRPGSGIAGLWLGIEVKTERDRLSQKQKNFRDMILAAGGIWLECRSVEDTLEELEKYR